MLPIVTTGQVKNGIQPEDLLIDLSDYLKKQEGATKTEVQSLSTAVAGKLDKEPIHKHDISDINQLTNVLKGKYDTSEKYSYNVILSDSEKIPYLESPKVEILEIVADKNSDGYRFYVDDSNGDLMIIHGETTVATYTKSTHSWSFGGVSLSNINSFSDSLAEIRGLVTDNSVDIVALDTKVNGVSDTVTKLDGNFTRLGQNVNGYAKEVNDLTAQLNEYITKTDAILKNHYDALLLLCKEHEMIDSDGTDGNKITPAAGTA